MISPYPANELHAAFYPLPTNGFGERVRRVKARKKARKLVEIKAV